MRNSTFKKIKIGHDPRVPQNYYKAIRDKEWKEAIDRELTKFGKESLFKYCSL